MQITIYSAAPVTGFLHIAAVWAAAIVASVAVVVQINIEIDIRIFDLIQARKFTNGKILSAATGIVSDGAVHAVDVAADACVYTAGN